MAVAQVSYQPDEVGLEADDGRVGGRAHVSAHGGEVLSGAEDVLAGLAYGVHLLQEAWGGNEESERHESSHS